MSVRLGALYASCRQHLRSALSNCPHATPDLDARLLIGHALNLPDHTPISDPALSVEQEDLESIEALIDRRAMGEPVARLVGYRDFWGRQFTLNAETLIPRPETEGIVETVLNWANQEGLGNKSLQIADIGTGSGAIIVSLLADLPYAIGTGTDISELALEAATKNATHHEVMDQFTPVRCNYGEALAGNFDVITSNPPYIRDNDRKNTSEDVLRHEPARALFGGPDGLEAYRTLLPWCHQVLRDGGICVLEHGFDQQEQVISLAKQAGFGRVEAIKDLNDLPRLVKMVKKSDE